MRDRGQALSRDIRGPKANHVLKVVRGLNPKADLGPRVHQDPKAVQDLRASRKADLVRRAVQDLKVFPDQGPGPVQNPKAYQDRDHVQDLKAAPVADPVLVRLDLGHVPDPGQDPDPGILDQTHRYPGNPYPQVKTKLRLSCKYLTFSLVFDFNYLYGMRNRHFHFRS